MVQAKKKGSSATNATKKRTVGKPTQGAAIPSTSTSEPAAQRPALRDATVAVNNTDMSSIDDLRGMKTYLQFYQWNSLMMYHPPVLQHSYRRHRRRMST
jgi:hypothetical protein